MAARRASPSVRRAAIVELVARRGETSVEALAERFSASPETIRRDLGALADAGELRKFHGGARPLERREEGPFSERMARNPLAKRLIAEKLAKLVSPGETLFLDTGSTTLACAEALAGHKGLTAITNSTRIAAALSAGKARVFLLGGEYRRDNAQTVGPAAIVELARYRADRTVLTVGALDASGAMDFCPEEAAVARAMMAAADRTLVVADGSKLETRASFRVCALEAIDTLITERAPPTALAAACAAAGVAVP